MGVFTNQTPSYDYGGILNVNSGTQIGLTNVLQQVQDAFGNPTPLSLSTIAINIARSGFTWYLDSVAVTAQAVDINSMCQPNPVALGMASLTIPVGPTSARPGSPVTGMERFNTTTGEFEGYNGAAWVDFATGGTVVTTITGTLNQIDINGSPTTPATGNVVVSIDSLYPGQASITTVGTITSGTWHSTVISPQYGGTGINNGSNTITLGGTLTTSGPYNSIFVMTANTNVTFPTSGTLATTATANVASVSGTAGEIDVSPTTGNVIVSIDAGYVGQTSITTLGSITSGIWEGSTIHINYGGTGASSFTPYGVVCGGTTSTGALQSIAVGNSGQVLMSSGPGALPQFQNNGMQTWSDQTTTPETLVPFTSYFADTAGLLTFNMPASVIQGAEYRIAGKGAGGWLIQLSAGQTCVDDTLSTSSGGAISSSSSQYCSVDIVCLVANTTFSIISSNGNIGLS